MRYFLLIALCLNIFCTGCAKKSTEPDNKKPPVDEWPFDPPSSEPLDAFEMNAKIGRGFNISALEAPNEGDWGIIIKDEYLQAIADAGFNSIRLPVTWATHTRTTSPYTIDTAFFERIDHLVQKALSLGLVVVLNCHHFDQLNEDPVANRDWLLKIWEQISQRYKDYPDELFFEILNEPHGAFNNSATVWNQLAKDALVIIRQTNPYRMVVIGPINWNAFNYVPTMNLPEDDPGIIVTFHYYLPFNFTHQGASWVDGSNAWLGTYWMGSVNERQAVANDFETALRWTQQHNRPLYLGEFGAFSTADDNSRYRWTDCITRTAEKKGISWTYWEFCAGFGAYDPEKDEWRPLLLKALMPQ